MEHQTTKLTLTQKVAIYWLKNVDSSNLLLFNTLKSLNQGFRLFFYMGLITFTFLGMKLAMSFVDFSTAPMAWLWTLLTQFVSYGVVVGIFLVVTLESIYKLDIPQILQNQKNKKEQIKAQKLQRWRLRNMNIFMRILVYISFYMLCVFIIQISAFRLFVDIFAVAQNTPETQHQVSVFMSEFENFTRWFTFIYLTSALVLDYFVSKKRRAVKEAQKEAQHETVI